MSAQAGPLSYTVHMVTKTVWCHHIDQLQDTGKTAEQNIEAIVGAPPVDEPLALQPSVMTGNTIPESSNADWPEPNNAEQPTSNMDERPSPQNCVQGNRYPGRNINMNPT